MYKKLPYILLLALLIFSLVSCSKASVTDQPNEDNIYEIVTLSDVKNSGVSAWVNNNYKYRGYYEINNNESADFQYLLIAAGEMNTGGYSLEITEYTEDEERITFTVKLKSPGKDDIVTMAITYPYLLLKVNSGGRKINVEYIDNNEDKSKPLIIMPRVIKFRHLNGEFLENNKDSTIKIKITDIGLSKDSSTAIYGTRELYVPDNLLDRVAGIQKGDKVLFDYLINKSKVNILEAIILNYENTDIQSEKGVFLSNTNENQITIQTANEVLTFKYPEFLEAKMTSLSKNEAIDVEYLTDSNKEKEIYNVINRGYPGTPADCEDFQGKGSFIEFQENHSCLIIIDGNKEIFWIAEECINDYYTKLKKNDEVNFVYYIDQYGRRVILGFRN